MMSLWAAAPKRNICFFEDLGRPPVYTLIFIGRSGEPFPSGVEINAVVDALEPIDSETLDRDLWAILRWMIRGVGGAWTVEDFDRTGRLYRVAAAPAN